MNFQKNFLLTHNRLRTAALLLLPLTYLPCSLPEPRPQLTKLGLLRLKIHSSIHWALLLFGLLSTYLRAEGTCGKGTEEEQVEMEWSGVELSVEVVAK